MVQGPDSVYEAPMTPTTNGGQGGRKIRVMGGVPRAPSPPVSLPGAYGGCGYVSVDAGRGRWPNGVAGGERSYYPHTAGW